MRAISRLGVTALLLVGLVTAVTRPAFATNWINVLASGSAGEAQGGSLPSVPTGVSDTCSSPSASKMIVTWTAATRATSYTIYQSTTSATGTYTAVAPGVTGTSWTSGVLASGNYWFEVSSSIGSNWASARSAATGESTVSKNTSCVQP